MTTLAELSPRLLLSISDHLPLVDFICFSLCNRRLLALSLRQTNRLPRTKDDNLSILIRLEGDLPRYFACDVCNLIHQYDGSETFGLSGLAHERTCQLSCVGEWFGMSFVMRTHPGTYSANHLSFLQLKIAMRRFYYGPRFGISTDSLSDTQVRHAIHADRISLFSTEAQICPEPLGLCIRMPDIMLVGTPNNLIYSISAYWGPQCRYDPCPHTRAASSAGRLYPLPCDPHSDPCPHNLLVDPSSHDGEKASFAHTCHECNTDTQIEIIEFDSKIAVIMKRWVNLGPGLTKDDLLWRNHVRFGRHDGDGPKQSARMCFEDMAPQSFEDLRFS
ncbi:unnamed protein product [Penicillium egyptiacum]|uniref:F-box domain-containing protein n=1 Tax=Penicillium egyptiacum TaxID=1303716 RepID=A0A9W4KB84_9EURO|nr:unnamed protein product [Penicillium egyptiacum]